MERQILTVAGNRSLNDSVFELVLKGASPMRAGQFVEIAAEGFFLRRPISVADSDGDRLVLLIRQVGEGTKALRALRVGDKADVITGLGNGFDLSAKQPLLLGGGIGCAPLYLLAKEFVARGVRPQAVLGFRNRGEIYYADEFADICDVTVATDDGSAGLRTNAVAAVGARGIVFDRFYACGPTVMLKAAAGAFPSGQVSLEARMGCGFGVCMGCSIKTASGFKRVCKEGPVFEASEVMWE